MHEQGRRGGRRREKEKERRERRGGEGRGERGRREEGEEREEKEFYDLVNQRESVNPGPWEKQQATGEEGLRRRRRRRDCQGLGIYRPIWTPESNNF